MSHDANPVCKESVISKESDASEHDMLTLRESLHVLKCQNLTLEKDMDNLYSKIDDMQENYRASKRDMNKLYREIDDMKVDYRTLQIKYTGLEDRYINLLGQTIALSKRTKHVENVVNISMPKNAANRSHFRYTPY